MTTTPLTHVEADQKWKALDGFEFADGAFQLELHEYDNGRAAVQVYNRDNEPWCRLTVNLPEHPLAPGEFHVRREDLRNAGTMFATLRGLGKIEPTGKVVGAGFSAEYAEVWKLR